VAARCRGAGRFRSSVERQVWLAEGRAGLVAAYGAEPASYGVRSIPIIVFKAELGCEWTSASSGVRDTG
jgi:hypothetical protein